MTRSLLLGFLLGSFFMAGFPPKASSNDGSPAVYGSVLAINDGGKLAFPDFELTYLGVHRLMTPAFKPGVLIHDFTAEIGGHKVAISWSSGTGDIGPSLFEVQGVHYELEMSRSDKLGRLKSGEIVVWKK